VHFRYSCRDGIITISADPKEEHGDRIKGVRVQGDKTEIELIENEAQFGLALDCLEPDNFALAAVLIFLPFIGRKVSFSVPVSQSLQDFLASPALERVIGHNIEVITKVKRNSYSFGGATLSGAALALGGGFDAVAIKTLLPETFSYHQLSAMIHNRVYHYPAYRFFTERDNIFYNGNPICDEFIWTNVENIVRPRGVTTWLTFALSAILMAPSRGLNCVLTGTVFEGSFCSNGIKYVEYNPISPHNFMANALKSIGVEVIPAATMMPEYVNCVQVLRSGLGNSVSHCIMSPSGGPCGVCMKCYRKKLLYELYKKESGMRVPQFDMMSIEQFDTDWVRRQAESKPMYLASSFRWLIDRLPERMFVPPVRRAMRTVPRVEFGLNRMYGPAFDFIPENIRKPLFERATQQYDLMTDMEVAAVRSWDLTRCS
jgi:hypothetical protein